MNKEKLTFNMAAQAMQEVIAIRREVLLGRLETTDGTAFHHIIQAQLNELKVVNELIITFLLEEKK